MSCNISNFCSYDKNTDKIINKVVDDEEDNNKTTITEQINDTDDNELINKNNDKSSKLELQAITELKELIKKLIIIDI